MSKNLQHLIVLFSVVIVIFSCAAPGKNKEGPAQTTAPTSLKEIETDWKIEWERTLIAAKKEGKVVVTSGMGPHVRKPLGESFEKNFGIQVEWIPARGAETAEKVLRERRAGIYSYDLYTSGSSTALGRLKPVGAIVPLEHLLLLPEVKDSQYWFQNRLPWSDQDKTVFTFWLDTTPNITINTNLVRKEEMKSYRDLLDPKWKGKIAMDDPTVTGSANRWAVIIGNFFPSLGWDFQRSLAKQEPILMRDRRQMAEWVARGKYPLTIPNSSQAQELQRLGLPLDFVITKEGLYAASGNGQLAYYNNAPHPNAAKIFVNWLLSKEAQEIAALAEGTETTRLDVTTSHLPPGWSRAEVIKATGTLINPDDESYEKIRIESMPIIQEIWGPLVK